MNPKIKVLLLAFFCSFNLFSQSFLEPAPTRNNNRLIGVSATSIAAWGGSVAGLQFVWYKDFEKSPFHLFNDFHEWNQMDKMGHLYSAYHFTGLMNNLYHWSGIDHKKSALIGAAYSFGYMTSLEVLDAYNAKWGFSLSDMGFNTLGIGLYASQAYFFNEQYVRFKFSFHDSGLAEYRPNVLGSDFANKVLKDYNGQTYWLSFNPLNWTKKTSKIPKWISISLGYSTENQLIGDGGSYIINDGVTQLNFTPYRQYYLSLDIDFEQIPVESRVLKIIFKGLNKVKLPFPTLEYSQGSLSFHPLYF